ncbi:MAG: YdcF family protein [Euzebya sp.]
MIRRLIVVCAWLLAAVIVYFAVTFAQVWWTASHDQAQPADAIVVLGAAQYDGEPSPVFQGRLDHAAWLYSQGLSPVVVVTGGRQPGDLVSEAYAAYDYLQHLGVPQQALRLETGGQTSYESLAAAALFLSAEGIEEVILVSDGWHLRRSAAIAAAVGLTPRSSPTPQSPYSTARSLQLMVRETAGLAIGQLIGFRRLDRLAAL